MNNEVLLEIVKTVGIIATGIISTIGLIWSQRTRKEQKDLKIMVDGRLTELIAANKIADTKTGKEEGIAQQKAETKEDTKIQASTVNPIKLEIPNLVVEIKPPVAPPPPEEKK